MKENCLVIGVGGIGLRHLRCLKKINKFHVYIYDIKKPNLNRLITEKLADDILFDLEEINNLNLKFVIISSPSKTHFNYSKTCYLNNIHFLLEKPVMNNLDFSKDLLNLDKKSKIKSAVAFPRRFSKGINKIKSLLSDNELGKIFLIKGNFSQDFRKYRPDFQKTYYSKISNGGGIIQDALPHYIDLFMYFFGRVYSHSSLASKNSFQNVEGNDYINTNLIFENGVQGEISCNQYQKPNYDIIEIIGEMGNIIFDRILNTLTIKKTDNINDDIVMSFDDDWDEIFYNQLKYFINCIENNKDVRTSIRCGIENLKLIHSILNSRNNYQAVEY